MNCNPKIYVAGHRGMGWLCYCAHLNVVKAVYAKLIQPMLSHINVGCGYVINIHELTKAICVGYTGEIVFDFSKPDGAPPKLMDSSRLDTLGWKASMGLEEGLASTYQDFLLNSLTSPKVQGASL